MATFNTPSANTIVDHIIEVGSTSQKNIAAGNIAFETLCFPVAPSIYRETRVPFRYETGVNNLTFCLLARFTVSAMSNTDGHLESFSTGDPYVVPHLAPSPVVAYKMAADLASDGAREISAELGWDVWITESEVVAIPEAALKVARDRDSLIATWSSAEPLSGNAIITAAKSLGDEQGEEWNAFMDKIARLAPLVHVIRQIAGE